MYQLVSQSVKTLSVWHWQSVRQLIWLCYSVRVALALHFDSFRSRKKIITKIHSDFRGTFKIMICIAFIPLEFQCAVRLTWHEEQLTLCIVQLTQHGPATLTAFNVFLTIFQNFQLSWGKNHFFQKVLKMALYQKSKKYLYQFDGFHFSQT